MMFCSSTFEPDGFVLVELSIICHQSYVANNYVETPYLIYIYIKYYNYKYRYIAIYIINILSYKKYIMNKEFIHNRLNFNILYKSVKICL